MKTKFYMIATAIVAMAMTSCEDMGEKDLYDPSKLGEVLQEEYNQAFSKEFGEIPADQSWDFYAQVFQDKATKGTRAGGDVVVTPTSQPTDLDFSVWQTMLKKETDNREIGTRDFSLVSNGPFKVYAVWFAGYFEAYSQYKFELGVYVDGQRHKIFNGCGKDRSDPVYQLNPEMAAEVDIPRGKSFQFYLRYEQLQHEYVAFSGPGESSSAPIAPYAPVYSYGNASLWYSDMVTADKQMMVIGFEDKMRMDWKPLGKETPDCNDVILYIEGSPNLPMTEAKRFMCEDLGTIGDFDFNDVVFDIRPFGSNKAEVILQAAGGTFPINLYVAGNDLGEVHELLGVEVGTMVNTGMATAEPYKTITPVPDDFDLTMFNDVKLLVTNSDASTYWINYSGTGQAPSFIATPIDTKWAKEKINIKKGYPLFFSANWYQTPIDEFLYK